MRIAIQILSGPSMDKDFVLEVDAGQKAAIGRAPDCELQVLATGLSRRHCEFEVTPDGRCLIRDLRSANGTIVSGKRVKETEIGGGEEVRIGPVTFRVDLVGSEGTASVSPVSQPEPEPEPQPEPEPEPLPEPEPEPQPEPEPEPLPPEPPGMDGTTPDLDGFDSSGLDAHDVSANVAVEELEFPPADLPEADEAPIAPEVSEPLSETPMAPVQAPSIPQDVSPLADSGEVDEGLELLGRGLMDFGGVSSPVVAPTPTPPPMAPSFTDPPRPAQERAPEPVVLPEFSPPPSADSGTGARGAVPPEIEDLDVDLPQLDSLGPVTEMAGGVPPEIENLDVDLPPLADPEASGTVGDESQSADAGAEVVTLEDPFAEFELPSPTEATVDTEPVSAEFSAGEAIAETQPLPDAGLLPDLDAAAPPGFSATPDLDAVFAPEPEVVAEPKPALVAELAPDPVLVAEPEPEVLAEPEPEVEVVAEPAPAPPAVEGAASDGLVGAGTGTASGDAFLENITTIDRQKLREMFTAGADQPAPVEPPPPEAAVVEASGPEQEVSDGADQLAPVEPPPPEAAVVETSGPELEISDDASGSKEPEADSEHVVMVELTFTSNPVIGRAYPLRVGIRRPDAVPEELLQGLFARVSTVAFEAAGENRLRADGSGVAEVVLSPWLAGPSCVRVDLFQAGRYLGSASVACEVQSEASLVDEQVKVEVKVPLPGLDVGAPDLVLLVESVPVRDHHELNYLVYSGREELGLDFRSVGTARVRRDGLGWHAELQRELAILDDESEEGARSQADRLASLGLSLYERLWPEDLRLLYWQLREQVSSLLILADDPWLPWELMRSFRETDGGFEEDGFLVERVSIGRWRPGEAPASRVDVTSALVCTSGLSEALGRHGVETHSLSNGLEQVASGLRDSSADLVELAVPLRYVPEADARMVVELADGDSGPAPLAKALGDRSTGRPAIFCGSPRGPGAAPELTGLPGLAEPLLSQGASVVLGPMWTVSDQAAADFSAALVDALAGGASLGEAVARGRKASRRDEDPSWLAFSLFGDPSCGVVLGAVDD